MSNEYSANITRFFFILLLQVLVIQYIPMGKINIYIYPLFILLLPLEWPHAVLIVGSFFYGFLVDIFYDMDGLHAASLIFVGFVRPLVCALLEPRGGYEIGQTLTRHSLGISWFLQYSGVLIFLHCFLITLLEELSLSLVFWIRFGTTFFFSMLLIILYQFILNPKN